MVLEHTRMRALLCALVLGSALGACDEPAGPAGPGGGGGGGGPGGGGPELCAENDNDAMRMRMAATCAPCHGEGASRPFFASATAFEDLLVYNPRYVVRGDPDASELVALLEARGTGAYVQMPLSGDSYAALAARGETGATMEEIRAWIRDLPPPDPSRAGPDTDASTIRRLSADEAINALEVALGQEPSAGVPPLLRMDGVAPLAPDSPTGIDYNDARRRQTYLMLGGQAYLQQRMPEPTWSPSSLITWTQVAQGACTSAVDARREELFVHASPTATLPDAEPDVRANIAYLYERFLHEPASDADVEALFTRIYVPAAASSPREGWVQVCTSLARDPLFITF